jgi:hypothetical protein
LRPGKRLQRDDLLQASICLSAGVFSLVQSGPSCWFCANEGEIAATMKIDKTAIVAARRIEKFLGGQSNPAVNYTAEKNDGEHGFCHLAIMVQ